MNKTVVQSESGHQWFIVDENNQIEMVFYNYDTAVAYASKKVKK